MHSLHIHHYHTFTHAFYMLDAHTMNAPQSQQQPYYLLGMGPQACKRSGRVSERDQATGVKWAWVSTRLGTTPLQLITTLP
jgi:hypothetical protein